MVDEQPSEAPAFEGASAALEFAVWSLSDQVRTIETTDGKSERALTLAVAVIGLFSGALTFQLDEAGRAEAVVGLIAAPLVVVCFVAATWLFFRSYAMTNWYLGPQSENLLSIAAEHTQPRVRQWLAEQIFASVQLNADQIEAKTVRSTRLFRAVLAETIFASGGVSAVAVTAALS